MSINKERITPIQEGHNGLCCTIIENISVTLGKTNILKEINLHIHCGELTAIIGPNGAGKSTLLKAMLGEISHSGNLLFLDEKDNKILNPKMGYVPQYLNFDLSTPTSVLDLFIASKSYLPVWLFKKKKTRKQVLSLLKEVEGEDLIDKRLGCLSGGELQRVMLALALDPMPNLLLLDEPVSGMDQNGLGLFYKLVSNLRKIYDLTIILVSHDLDLVAKYADRVILLDKTVICNDTPQNVFSNEKTKKIFKMPSMFG